MAKNPILEELYAARAQLQSEHGAQLAEHLRCEFERKASHGHAVAHIVQRRIRPLASVQPSKPSGNRNASDPDVGSPKS